MFVICLFFYADLLTYKITPIIDLCFSFFISQYISQKYKISQCEFFPISCSPSVYPCSSQKTGGDNYPSSIFLINHLFIHSLTALIDAFLFFLFSLAFYWRLRSKTALHLLLQLFSSSVCDLQSRFHFTTSFLPSITDEGRNCPAPLFSLRPSFSCKALLRHLLRGQLVA